VAAVKDECRWGEAVTWETRYSLTNLPGESQLLPGSNVAIGGNENRLQWVLDVAVHEDES
jgi:hypothetical protein